MNEQVRVIFNGYCYLLTSKVLFLKKKKSSKVLFGSCVQVLLFKIM